jgi:hypothetical protein
MEKVKKKTVILYHEYACIAELLLRVKQGSQNMAKTYSPLAKKVTW